ncbi:MAG TPA: hypothetical protein PKC88_16930 [Plasticicumulans sp.]|nr:cytochrome c554 and c-prime family protein [Thauera sp. SWB20]HMW44055.1 hypothetical protein [Plasticicumulans sp.]
MRLPVLILLLAGINAAMADAPAYPVAGLQPDARPAGAPVIHQHTTSEAAKTRLQRGIVLPAPATLAVMRDQEAWYTPFDQPGMLGYYDLRGWHAAAPKKTAAKKSAKPGGSAERPGEHMRATYSPLHFKPAIETATDAQCLACHADVLEDKPLARSPAGVAAKGSLAWYQQVSTYQGEQDSFHRRHLVTPLAKQLMDLKCTTCHQGHDPRDEAPGTSANTAAQGSGDFTLRKAVNTEAICLKCHGQPTDYTIMGLPGPWHEVRIDMQNDCLACHVAFRTNRHQVNYLKPAAIEAAAEAGREHMAGGDVCFGCHGGRPWYRIAYPFARNAWPGMADEVPEWAKDRPTRSEARFLIDKPAAK